MVSPFSVAYAHICILLTQHVVFVRGYFLNFTSISLAITTPSGGCSTEQRFGMGGSVTWPEEKLPLPLWDLLAIRDENGHRHRRHQDHQQRRNKAPITLLHQNHGGLSL
ncbi:unnamed protein product [Malus baccata var. baccata]